MLASAFRSHPKLAYTMAFAGARLDVAALPLPPTVRHKLQCAGFRTTKDLEGIQPLDLANGV